MNPTATTALAAIENEAIATQRDSPREKERKQLDELLKVSALREYLLNAAARSSESNRSPGRQLAQLVLSYDAGVTRILGANTDEKATAEQLVLLVLTYDAGVARVLSKHLKPIADAETKASQGGVAIIDRRKPFYENVVRQNVTWEGQLCLAHVLNGAPGAVDLFAQFAAERKSLLLPSDDEIDSSPWYAAEGERERTGKLKTLVREARLAAAPKLSTDYAKERVTLLTDRKSVV